MEVELLEIRDFLARHAPFAQLPGDTLDQLPARLELRYAKRGTALLEAGGNNAFLYMIRSGAAEIRDESGDLLSHLGEGGVFGYRSLFRGGKVEVNVNAMEDCLLYQLPSAEFERLHRDHPAFGYFFGPSGADRLRNAIEHLGEPQGEQQVGVMTTPISELLVCEPVSLSPAATVREAAALMCERRVSSMLVIENGALAGILTDRDLRSRVLASGRDYDTPLREVMTPQPMTVEASAPAFDALLSMARHNVHHLPVISPDGVDGMITATDLLQRHSTSAVHLVGDVYKRNSAEEMAEISAAVPQLLVNLVGAGTTAQSTGHVITAVGEAITCRLLQLAEERFGPPPIPYAWIVCGSQARNEQTAHSDQDNGIVLDDSYDPAAHGDYFRQLADFVCDGLDACGYIYCPGEIMAKTDKWRQPLAVWKSYFAKWIDEPEPKALMHASIFFDMRCLYGECALFEQLHRFQLNKSAGNRIFLAFMAGNALSHTPPLGFFRNFVLIKGGEHNQTIDLKHNGVVPIIDLARVYALAGGSPAVNTYDRLQAAMAGGEVSQDSAKDLLDAFEFISQVRLEHQARQIRSGEKANHFASPNQLSHFERDHLKDAFSVVRTLQQTLAQRYRT